MINIKVLLSLLLINLSVIFSQTTYYISSSEGNDSNNGTSESQAWATLDKLNDNWSSIAAGDSILLKRGDIWAPSSTGGLDGIITIPNMKAGTRGNPIVLDAYGSTSDPKPIISGANITTSGISLIYSNACEWIEFRNLKLIRGGSSWTMFYMNVSVSGYPIGSAGFNMGLNHITFYGLDMVGSDDLKSGAVYLNNGFSGGSPTTWAQSKVPQLNDDEFPKKRSIRFEYNTFTNMGYSGGAINIAPYDSCYVGYNTFYYMGIAGEAIDIAGGTDHIVEYNKLYKVGANGMKFHSQYRKLEDLIVRGNLIVYNGNGSTHGAGLVLQNAKNCKVYNNTVYAPMYAAYFGNRDRLPYEAYFSNFEGNVIRNNIFYGMVQFQGTWENVTFGDSTMPYTNQTQGTGSIWNDNTFTNNTYYTGHPSDYIMRFWRNSGYPNVDEDTFRDITLSNTSEFTTYWVDSTSSTEIMRDPLFTDPYVGERLAFDPYTPGDYTLTSGSSEINSGIIIEGYTQDINGNPIVGLPDRGAYEFNGTDITAPRVTGVNLLDETTLLVSFSEPLNIATAQNINNYSIDNGITISRASLSGNQVTLTASAHTPGNYTLIVNNIQDLNGNVINPEANTISYSFSSAIDTTAIVEYDFIQGETPGLINDISGSDNPVDLIIESVADVEWLQPNGISINSPTKILSKHPAKKITDACIQTGEVSVAVWLKPHTLNQNGPARIASLSENSIVRNFTLGHGGTDGKDDVFDFRLRTTESNSNGLPSVTTQPGYMTTTSPNHLVYTRDKNGVSKIFLNSIEIESASILGDFSNWDNTFHFIIGNEFTGDRPWLGEIYNLSIYDVALSNYKIDSLYSVNVVTNTNDDVHNLPNSFILEQNYPNPFNPSTRIKFSLPTQSFGAENKSDIPVKLIVYDILGNKIATLVDEYKTPGIYEVEFNGKALSSGIYFYKIDAGAFRSTKNMILLK